jgi:hypothetical protein
MGPSLSYFRIDWQYNGLTLWTRRASVIFEANFLSQYRLGSFPELDHEPRPGQISKQFVEYIKHLKRAYREKDMKKDGYQQRARTRSRRQQVGYSQLFNKK